MSIGEEPQVPASTPHELPSTDWKGNPRGPWQLMQSNELSWFPAGGSQRSRRNSRGTCRNWKKSRCFSLHARRGPFPLRRLEAYHTLSFLNFGGVLHTPCYNSGISPKYPSPTRGTAESSKFPPHRWEPDVPAAFIGKGFPLFPCASLGEAFSTGK